MRALLPVLAIALLTSLLYEPDSVTTRDNLAWLLATSGDPSLRDPERAVVLAEEARKAEGDADPELLDTLSAAQASASGSTARDAPTCGCR